MNKLNFHIDLHKTMTGTALTSILGPTIEAWNKKWDRNAALQCLEYYTNDTKVEDSEKYKVQSAWKIKLVLTGASVNSNLQKEAEKTIIDSFNM